MPSLKSSKKINKFALFGDEEEQNADTGALTHKGKSIKEIKHFNDMDFAEDDFSELF